MAQGVLVSVEMPDGSRRNLPVEVEGDIKIGRDESCHVVLPSPAVSREHLIVTELIGRGFKVADQSANGTIINGKRLKGGRAVIGAGTTLGVGPYKVMLRLIDPPEDSEASVPNKAARTKPSGSTADVPPELRRRIHRMLLEHLDLASLDRADMRDDLIRPKVKRALTKIIRSVKEELPSTANTALLMQEMTDEVLGLGPLEELLADDAVSEIMVVDPHNIYVERAGRLSLSTLRFTDNDSARAVIERIITPLGRRIDESTPLVDARLKDGSRVNAIIPPLAIRGPCITIRKFAKSALTIDDLVGFGSMTERMAKFLVRAVKVRKNIVISGGTGSGKTTLLNVLSGAIPDHERIITIEDAAELRLGQPHVVSLETRPANMEGKGEYSIRDLVRNALRMRPDRIVVGECRGGEALDMLQAMNTGHEGSMTTTHANSPVEGVKRLETLCLMSGIELPARAIRDQIATSVHLVVQQTRFSDGSRRVSAISELVGLNDDGSVELNDIFVFDRTGTDADGKIAGDFRALGYMPTFITDFVAAGLVPDGDYF